MTDDGPFIFGPARVVAIDGQPVDRSAFHGAQVHLDARPFRRHLDMVAAAATPQDDVRRLLDPGSVVRKALGEFD